MPKEARTHALSDLASRRDNTTKQKQACDVSSAEVRRTISQSQEAVGTTFDHQADRTLKLLTHWLPACFVG